MKHFSSSHPLSFHMSSIGLFLSYPWVKSQTNSTILPVRASAESEKSEETFTVTQVRDVGDVSEGGCGDGEK